MKTQVEKQELKEVLGRWAGFRWHVRREYVHGYLMHGGSWVEGHWDYKGECSVEGMVFGGLPDFLSSIDACFRWFVPKLFRWEITNIGLYTRTITAVVEMEGKDGLISQATAMAETPSLALCLAIKKLIKEKEEHGS